MGQDRRAGGSGPQRRLLESDRVSLTTCAHLQQSTACDRRTHCLTSARLTCPLPDRFPPRPDSAASDLDSENQRYSESVKENNPWITLLTPGFNTLFQRLTSARINRTSAGVFRAQTCPSFRRYSRRPGGPRRPRWCPSPGPAIRPGGTAAAPGGGRTIR